MCCCNIPTVTVMCVAAISWPTDMSEVGEVAQQAINALLTMDPRKRPGAPRESCMHNCDLCSPAPCRN